MKKKILSLLKILLFISLGFAVIAWFWHNLSEEDKKQFWDSINKANYFWLVVSIIFGGLSHLSRSLRWGQIIEPFGYSPRKPNLFFAVMSMYFANMAVPRLGEVTRCATLHKYEKIPFEKSFGTVVAERAIDIIMLLVIMGITYLLMSGHIDSILENFKNLQPTSNHIDDNAPPGFWQQNIKWIIAGSMLILFATLYLLRSHPFIGKIYAKFIQLLKGFWEGLRSAIRVKHKITFIIHTLFIWFMYFMMTYICFLSLPETANISYLAGLTIMVGGSIATIIVPGGIGIFPVVVAAVLHIPLFGKIDPGIGLALGWIIWASQTLLIIMLGIFSVIALPIYNKS
ncbi:MAG: flippase-like domain-containing protein [Candidatus Competibacteraceae bacterium]|nr:flippase-like domain-containing protein [Candidatus Competibacteraceae bacterium]